MGNCKTETGAMVWNKVPVVYLLLPKQVNHPQLTKIYVNLSLLDSYCSNEVPECLAELRPYPNQLQPLAAPPYTQHT